MKQIQFQLTVALALSMCSLAIAENDYSTDSPSQRIREKAKVFAFSSTAPDDCEFNVEFSGAKQHYAQLRYGTEGSIRIALVVDQLSTDRSDFDLYVDLDRDRRITKSEKIDGTGKSREFDLQVEIMSVGEAQHFKRRVQFRRSVDESRFSLKTKGGFLGKSSVAEKLVDVWRMDGNANGLFSDVEDELWIDLNGDSQWNPINERFLYRSAIKVGQLRLAVRGDQLGSQIDFAKIEGEGKLALDLGLNEETKINSLKASIFGDDGSAHSIEGTEPIVLPVGKYTIGQISVRLQQGDEREWHFSFSHSGNSSTQRWVNVKDADETVIAPFRTLSFSISAANSYVPGQRISATPRLYTGDNLYITGSGRGKVDQWGDTGGNPAKITAIDRGQRQFAIESTGFA